jgi:hypothetical protein
MIITPLTADNVKVEKMIYSNIQYNQNKKYINIFYENYPNKLYIQSPKLLYCVLAEKNKNYHELTIPLFNKKNSGIDKFVNLLKSIDKEIIDEALKNDEWFDKKNSKKTHKAIIKTIINENSNIYDNGVLILKLLDEIQIMDQENNNISIDDIPLNSHISLILNINAIWINNNKIGIYIKPVAIQVYREEKFLFIQEINELENMLECDSEDNSGNVKFMNGQINNDDNNTKYEQNIQSILTNKLHDIIEQESKYSRTKSRSTSSNSHKLGRSKYRKNKKTDDDDFSSLSDDLSDEN